MSSAQFYAVVVFAAVSAFVYFYNEVRLMLLKWLGGAAINTAATVAGRVVTPVSNAVGKTAANDAFDIKAAAVTTTDLYNLSELERTLGIVASDGKDPELIEFRAKRIAAKAAEITAKKKKPNGE
jgi:hypothetical protein